MSRTKTVNAGDSKFTGRTPKCFDGWKVELTYGNTVTVDFEPGMEIFAAGLREAHV